MGEGKELSEALGWRMLRVPEDAADGSILLCRVPPTPWRCGDDHQRNKPHWLNCVFCGKHREDVE